MARSNRRTIAWLCRRLATLALLGLSLVVAMGGSTNVAATAIPGIATLQQPSPTFPSASEEEEAEAEEAEEEWEWEEGEEEPEEGEGEGEGSDGSSPSEPPAACQLYEVSARVVASDRRDVLRLAIHYASSKPAKVKVEYWLKGGKGIQRLKSLRRRISRHGSLHGVERLSTREMEKVRAARTFVVDIEVPGTPSHCERYCIRHLTARHDRGAVVIWSEPPLGTQPLS